MTRFPLSMVLTEFVAGGFSVDVRCAEVNYVHGFQTVDELKDHALSVAERWVQGQYACTGKKLV